MIFLSQQAGTTRVFAFFSTRSSSLLTPLTTASMQRLQLIKSEAMVASLPSDVLQVDFTLDKVRNGSITGRHASYYTTYKGRIIKADLIIFCCTRKENGELLLEISDDNSNCDHYIYRPFRISLTNWCIKLLYLISSFFKYKAPSPNFSGSCLNLTLRGIFKNFNEI